MPDPAPAPTDPVPMPDPTPTPDPAPAPVPDPGPIVTPVTINIVSSFGSGAFIPNPLQASVGATIVWTNTDVFQHKIVLDDGTPNGTPIGTLAPGESTLPMTLTTATATYHCVFHPSMTGSISDPFAPAPPPVSEPPPVSVPPPSEPMPDDPYGGY